MELLRLDNLPHDVLHSIAVHLCQRDRIAALQLALAAPACYAPILHAVIRTDTACTLSTNPADPNRPLRDEAAGSVKYRMDMIGRVVGARLNNTCSTVSWSLILLPRDANRNCIPAPLKAPNTYFSPAVSASSHWSLLPVAASQIRPCLAHFREGWSTRDLPPYCTQLRLSGYMPPGQLVFPQSTEKLWLHHALFERTTSPIGVSADDSSPDGKEDQAPIHSVLTHLRHLHLRLDGRQNRAAINFILNLVPRTLASLSLQVFGGKDGLQLATDLVQRLPSLSALKLHALFNNKSLIPFLTVLPRSGFERLEIMIADHGSEDESDDDDDDWDMDWDLALNEQQERKRRALAELAASFPTSVKILSYVSPISLPRLPLATHELQINVEALGALKTLSFSPTLQRLELFSQQPHSTSSDLLVRIFSSLPAPLTHLKIKQHKLPGAVLTVLARHLPPQLEWLCLAVLKVVATEIDDHFTGHWPSTLLRLDLDANWAQPGLPVIPDGIRALSINPNMTLRQEGGEEIVAKWLAALPSSLRVLDLSWSFDLPEADLLASMLLEHLNIQMPGRRRMRVRVSMDVVSVEMLARLQERFDVVDQRTCTLSYTQPALFTM
ncbi:hypothetical protein AMAG_12325 [Allomyces macrogynus ATCC 38327]|uniref:Uncharacterized protein n=1 Tax=Allomyces macrogynus (strain ATCC 38327) TaxID=578462 RepID=A0A0L0SXM1_ALLM3|nr:hypothetical protein AMAG_12325 [Allomyces macrogynus ATCC 38327]|eukprot:KNE67257.1 hypothetical protein AMAG_12325 [Allomyces macrogynus ATCC 38327]